MSFKVLVNKWFFLLGFFLILLALIFLKSVLTKYLSWGFSVSEILPFIFVTIFTLVIVMLSFLLYKKIINPISAFCVFILGYGFSFIKFQNIPYNISLLSNVILIVSIFSFLGGVFLSFYVRLNTPVLSFSFDFRKSFLYTIYLIGIFTFALEVIRWGYIPITQILVRDVYNETNNQLIPILHYFVMLFAIIPSWLYIYYRNRMISRKIFVLLALLAFFVLCNFFSRQLLLTFLITGLFTYIRYNKVSLKMKLLFTLLPVVMFIGIGALRLTTLDIDPLAFLRYFGEIPYETSTIETYMSIYSTRNFYTFESFVQNLQNLDYSSYGMYTFSPILTITLFNRLFGLEIDPVFDSNKGLATYAIEPYMDFGFCGVFIINILYGFVCGIIFKEYQQKKTDALVAWSILLFCILMTVFTNYFNMLYIWMVLFLNKFVISNKFE